jgi:hypothetical protein
MFATDPLAHGDASMRRFALLPKRIDHKIELLLQPLGVGCQIFAVVAFNKELAPDLLDIRRELLTHAAQPHSCACLFRNRTIIVRVHLETLHPLDLDFARCKALLEFLPLELGADQSLIQPRSLGSR